MSFCPPEKLQHILQVLNTHTDERQQTAFAVTAVKGARLRYACVVLRKPDVDLAKRVGELTEDETERVPTTV